MVSSSIPVSYTHLDVYKRQTVSCVIDKLGLKGKHLAVIGTSSYPWIITYLGIVNSASVAVPLDASLPLSLIHI